MSSEEQVPLTEQLIDNSDQGCFELCRVDELVGWLYYTHLKPNRYALRHAEVETNHQHKGVGARWCDACSTRSAPAEARSP